MIYENPKNIKVGNLYIFDFGKNSKVYERTGKTTVLIRITYIRSNVIFFILPEYPGFEEENFHITSYMAERLEPVE